MNKRGYWKNAEAWSNQLTGQGISIEIAKDNVPHEFDSGARVPRRQYTLGRRMTPKAMNNEQYKGREGTKIHYNQKVGDRIDKTR